MKHTIYIIALACLTALAALPAHAVQDWKFYNSYHKPIDAVICGQTLYGLYEGGSLLTYDINSGEVNFLNRTTGLSSTKIIFMDYSATSKRLILAYEDGNIDIINVTNSQVQNIPQFQQNPDKDFGINGLWAGDTEALLATNEGVMRIRLRDAVIRGYCRIGATREARIVDNVIYAKDTKGSVRQCPLTSNPLDVDEWKSVPGNVMPGSARNNTEAMAYVRNNLTTYGPASNFHYALRWTGSRLLSVAGRVDANGSINYPHCVMSYDGKDWMQFSTDFSADPYPLSKDYYRNASDAIEDPMDPNRVFVSHSGVGVAEYYNGEFVTRYGPENSVLRSILPGRPYTRVSALAYDEDKNIWMANLWVDTVLIVRHSDGTWDRQYARTLSSPTTATVGTSEAEHIAFDQQGRLWLSDRRFAGEHRGGIFCWDRTTGQQVFRSTFVNEDGTTYTLDAVYTVVVDQNNQVWIGTNLGLFVVENPEEWFSEDFLMTQIKIAREDGSGLADYLLANTQVTCIFVDGANRKWIGTMDNGVYLVSADGLETLCHFTTKNSPIPSDCIYNIAINGQTGEVFMATEGGLVSYRGEATDPTMGLDRNNLHIYPNPLRPEQQGKVTITGLTANAEVMITTLGGQVVNKGRSLGGSYHWDVRDSRNVACKSGIYLVVVTTEDGKKSLVGKFAVVR